MVVRSTVTSRGSNSGIRAEQVEVPVHLELHPESGTCDCVRLTLKVNSRQEHTLLNAELDTRLRNQALRSQSVCHALTSRVNHLQQGCKKCFHKHLRDAQVTREKSAKRCLAQLRHAQLKRERQRVLFFAALLCLRHLSQAHATQLKIAAEQTKQRTSRQQKVLRNHCAANLKARDLFSTVVKV